MQFRTKIAAESATKALLTFEKNLGTAMGRESFKVAEMATGVIREQIADWLSDSDWGVSTGRLSRSFKPTFISKSSANDVTVGVFSDLVYAGIHETGGTITPTKGAYLAIPLNRTARRVSPRQYPKKLKYVPLPSGHKVLAIQMKTKIKPVYLLRNRVTLQAKNYLKKSTVIIDKSLPSYWNAVVGNEWDQVVTTYKSGPFEGLL